MRYIAREITDEDLKIDVISLRCETDASENEIEVRIAPTLGSNLYRLRRGKTDFIYADKERLLRRDWTGCYVLWPLPNRVRNKRFEFEGSKYSLEKLVRKPTVGPLIHGLVDDKAWNVKEITADENSARLVTRIEVTKGDDVHSFFPFESSLEMTYTLTAEGIRIDYTVTNDGKKNLPFGFALHPYFMLISGRDRTFVSVPANTVMEADDQLLPTGKLIDVQMSRYDLRKPVPISELALDHVYTSLDATPACICHPDKRVRIEIGSSEDFTHMVVYTPQKPYVCLENQTGSTDMINMHARAEKEKNETLKKAAHLLVVPPGGSHSGYISYALKTVL